MLMLKKRGLPISLLALVLSLGLLLTPCAALEDEPQENTGSSATGDIETSEDEFITEYQAPDALFEGEEAVPRDARGFNGVVASADPSVSAVGLEILKRGGNAADAAVAVGFALGLGEPCASGPGGNGVMLYYEAATGKTTVLDYQSVCPNGMTRDMFIYPFGYYQNYYKPGVSGSIAGVPGMVAGMAKANEMFGSMPLSEILEPVIGMAENGILVSSFMEHNYMDSYSTIELFEETAKVFTNDGFPYMAGDLFINPDYANTLRIIAEKGSDGFYKGEIARDIVDALKEHGGIMTMDDLAGYTVEVRQPLSTTYRGYTVMTAPPTSYGALILANLNLAEKFPVGSYGHDSAKYIHIWSEIFKMTWPELSTYIVDPNKYNAMGVYGLVTKAYANSRYRLLTTNKATASYPAGNPYLYIPDEESHTTHAAIIDKDGNMASFTHTISNFFGTYITPKNRGFLLMNMKFSPTSSYVQPQPGLRYRTPMSPVLLFDGKGNPFAALGCPGSERIVTTNTLMVSNLIDYKMDVQTAIDAPRIYDRYDELTVEGGISEEIVEQLRAMGRNVATRSALNVFFGGVQAVTRDPVTGELHGGADPRRGGQAVGY